MITYKPRTHGASLGAIRNLLQSITTMADRVPKQPLHPSVVSKLDPEYVEFHTSTLQYITPPHTLPWDPALRNAPAVPGGSAPLVVAKTQDFDLKYTKFRAFTPEGTAPEAGWPIFIFFHGGQRHIVPTMLILTLIFLGGWTLGNISSETGFTTNMSVREYPIGATWNRHQLTFEKVPSVWSSPSITASPRRTHIPPPSRTLSTP